jgi:hypothetical protein
VRPVSGATDDNGPLIAKAYPAAGAPSGDRTRADRRPRRSTAHPAAVIEGIHVRRVRGRAVRRAVIPALAVLAVLGGLAVGMLAATAAGGPRPSGEPATAASASSSPVAVASPVASATSSEPTPSIPVSTPSAPVATPTPSSTPIRVPDPLTGRLVTPDVAKRHPIAVMVDDLGPARPQSGFSAASIVWQAPAEGGIPRYMMIFQESIPGDVGPVRSSRYYYIAWASELTALYAHAGGSPQALATLRAQGHGQLVWNADEFRWGGSFRRSSTPLNAAGNLRVGPHNLYTTGKQLRALVSATGATDGPIKWPWTFARDAALGWRPVGGRIDVQYGDVNHIRYDYDRASNTYRRSVTGEKRQIDASTKKPVAPKNVIVMVVRFGALNDGHPDKHRLEADIIGSGPAWIATNGVTIKGTWRKTSTTSPTRFFDAKGRPVTLTIGQTFIQVMKTTDAISFHAGKPAPPDPFGAGGRPV